jgi:hypothetical protein
MNPHRFFRIAMLMAVSMLLILNIGFQPSSSTLKPSQTIVSGDEVPSGLSASDWSAIRGQIENEGYNIGSGYQAVNRSMGWQVAFGERGLQITPRDGVSWKWGLTLTGYGYAENVDNLVGVNPTLRSDSSKLTYAWDGNLSEWWQNSTAGLEQGFTLQERPAGQAFERPLQIEMAVTGTLLPVQQGDAIAFQNEGGTNVLTYAKLSVTDADGQVIPARMAFVPVGQEVRARITVADADAHYPLTIDPLVQQAYLKASNTGAGDQFGYAVAISGNTVVVGAYFEDSAATGINGNQADDSAGSAGAVYVFVYNAGVWSQQAYLKASNTNGSDRFGRIVAISGDTIAVGAPNEDSNATGVNGVQTDESAGNAGAVYIFVRSGTTWSQQAYLKASNTDAADAFGRSLSISGDTLVIGAPGEGSDATGVNGDQNNNLALTSGAAYVFVRSGTTWSQQAYLKASNTGTGDNFGTSISLSGDTLVVGAPGESSNATGVDGNQIDESAATSGAAYIFVRSGTTWSQQAYLKASNTGNSDMFGNIVTLSGNTAVVGAFQEDSNATGIDGDQTNNSAITAGAAYVFVRSGSTWSQQAYLKASNAGGGDSFGNALALSGDTLMVGASQEDSNATGIDGNQSDDSAAAAGAVYVFIRSGSTWSQLNYLKASNTAAGDNFGASVALSDDTLVVGATLEDSAATGVNGAQNDNSAGDSGAVYLFGASSDFGDLPSPYATTLANNGPRHMIVAGAPILGSVAPDIETDGQPNATAGGDDNNLVPDDEDGVTKSAGSWTNGLVSAGEGGAVNVTISTASACLGAFFDFNSSGILSDVVLRDNTGAVISQPIASGSYTFYFDIPAGTFPGSGPDIAIYSRFRVTSPVGGICTGSTAFSSTGLAADGEVEDYQMNFSPTAIDLIEFKSTPSANWQWLVGCVLVILASGKIIYHFRLGLGA